jgi:hypothetical protein
VKDAGFARPLVESDLDRIMKTPRFLNLRIHKNQKTLPPFSLEDAELYRAQEARRYRHPDKPWVYYNADGTTSIVGPVVKKKSQF